MRLCEWWWKFRWWLADRIAALPDKLRFSRATRRKWKLQQETLHPFPSHRPDKPTVYEVRNQLLERKRTLLKERLLKGKMKKGTTN